MAKSIKRIFASIFDSAFLERAEQHHWARGGCPCWKGRHGTGENIYIDHDCNINVGENNDHGWDGRVVGDVSRVKHILLLTMMTLPMVREVTTEA